MGQLFLSIPGWLVITSILSLGFIFLNSTSFPTVILSLESNQYWAGSVLMSTDGMSPGHVCLVLIIAHSVPKNPLLKLILNFLHSATPFTP